jgi:uncharacterized membrane protein
VRFQLKNEFVPIAFLGVLFIALVASNVTRENLPLSVLRVLLGMFFLLFVPGYALQAALFPYKVQFDDIERLALSLGLSFAIIPPVAFFLDQLPWGLDLWPILIAESILSASFASSVLYRRRSIPPAERFLPSLELGRINTWRREQDKNGKLFFYILAAAFIIIVVSVVVMLTVYPPGERFTEFYILGAGNLAQDYPREAQLNTETEVTLGISNREGARTHYYLRIYNDDSLIFEGPAMTLENDETIEIPVRFAPTVVGENIRIEFQLFQNDSPTPCCTLRVWLNVKPASEPQ